MLEALANGAGQVGESPHYWVNVGGVGGVGENRVNRGRPHGTGLLRQSGKTGLVYALVPASKAARLARRVEPITQRIGRFP
jgi:hypothetical protein